MGATQVDFLLSGFTDSSGNQLNGGKVYTYTGGTVSNKTTWSDLLKTTPLSNPIILDSHGKKQVFADGLYKFVVTDSNDATLYTLDNLTYGDSSVDQYGYTLVTETWVYASATTITVPTGAASKYQVGDRVRLTNSTVKYFVITVVADTLLTVFGGTDYTVANTGISSVSVSRAPRPFDFPAYFNYTPTYGAQAGNFSATPTTTYCRANITGKQYDVWVYFNGTLATATADYIQLTIPALADGNIYVHAQLDGQNSTFTDDCFAQQVTATNVVRIYRNDGADWATATFFIFGKISGFIA